MRRALRIVTRAAGEGVTNTITALAFDVSWRAPTLVCLHASMLVIAERLALVPAIIAGQR
jgi:hypothetical protein